MLTRFLALIAAAAALATSAAAQSTTLGSIQGSVIDPSNAAVPDATVRITNIATNVARELKTNSQGAFVGLSFISGVYRVEVSAPSFQRQVQDNIRLDVAGNVQLSFQLTVGQVTETVNVEAQAELLKSTEGVISTTIENKNVVELPLNGRNFNNLVRLTPGASRGTNGGGNTINSQTWAVTGSRSDNASYTLDGVYNNGTFFKTAAIHPSIDAIQEFKIQTNMSAKFGAAAGANINVAIRPGTNQVHGTIFYYLRNEKLDSREYFAATRPAFKWNQFGFSLGGPISIPKVYNGQNRTFWFTNYEGFRQRRAAVQLTTWATPAMFQGDLSRDLVGQPAAPIFNPYTERQLPNGTYTRDPFPGNRIPSSLIHPVAQTFQQLWVPQNLTPNTTANYINSTSSTRDDDQFHTRIDHRFSEKNTMFGRFSWADLNTLVPQNSPNANQITFNKYIGVAWHDTHIISPTTVLDIKFGYLRANNAQGPTQKFIEAYRQAGFVNMPTNFGPFDFPLNLNVTGFTSPGLGNLINGPDFTYQGNIGLTKIIGRHTLSMGFDYTRLRVVCDSVFTSFDFNNVPTADPQDLARTGLPMASFLLNLPSATNRIAGDSDLDLRQVLYHGYVQDDIRVNSKLTVNLGLRYEYNEWPHHIRGRIGGFDMTNGSFYWTGTNPISGAPPNIQKTIADPQYKNFAPRIGFAYRVAPRTVIRSAYGMFYNSNLYWEWSTGRGNWPYAVSNNFTNVNFPGTTKTRAVDMYATFDPATAIPQAQHTISRDLKMPYMQNWNFGIEHQLAQDLVIDLNYQGAKGTHLSSFLSTNDALPPGPGDVNPRRPYPEGGSLSELKTIASSRYHALTAKIEKRYSAGLSLIASYAWGKNIDLNSEFGGTSPQNNLNIRADMAPSGFDQTHIFNGAWVYEFPFFRNSNGFVKAILGGWQTTGILTLETGRPVNLTIPFDNANVGSRGNFQRPNLVGNPYPDGWEKTYGPAGLYFNPGAFAVANPYTFGNLGRNALRGPGYTNFDFGLYKNFNFTERVRLQYRFEAFNALNNSNFGQPNGSVTTPNFGRITGMANIQRTIQMALRLAF